MGGGGAGAVRGAPLHTPVATRQAGQNHPEPSSSEVREAGVEASRCIDSGRGRERRIA